MAKRRAECSEEIERLSLLETTKMPKLEDTRVVGNNLRERACSVLESGLGADCKFLVGEDRDEIPACRLLLAIASPVFEAILYGDLASTEAVEVPDIEPPVFRQLLKFIYCHQVELSSIEEAFAVFPAAHKYMMPELCDLCVSYMKRFLVSLKPWEMWCDALNFACLYKNEDLRQFVLQDISDRGQSLLNGSSELLKLDATSLKTILQQGYLDVRSEVEVVEAVTLWATARCQERGLSVDGSNLRDILITSGVRRHVRFLTLTEKELQDGPLKSGIVTSEEVSSLLQFMCTDDRCNLLEHLCPISEHRLTPKYTNKAFHTVRGKKDVLEIKQGSVLTVKFRKGTNGPITLLGLILDSQVHDEQTSMHSYEEEITVTVNYKQTPAVGLFKKKVNYHSELYVPLNIICKKQTIVDGDFDITLKYHKSGKYPVYVGRSDPAPPPAPANSWSSDPVNVGTSDPTPFFFMFNSSDPAPSPLVSRSANPSQNPKVSRSADPSPNPKDLTLLYTKLNHVLLGTRLHMVIFY